MNVDTIDLKPFSIHTYILLNLINHVKI